MIDLLQLPKSTTARAFFEEIAPDVVAELSLPEGISEQRCVFHVPGPTGGDWSVGVEDGKVSVAQGDVPGAPIQVTCTEEDGREFLLGSMRDRVVDALGGADTVNTNYQPQFFTQFLLSDSQLEKLAPFAGDLQLEIDDPDEMLTYLVTLTLGGGTPNTETPGAKLTIHADDWITLATQKITPQQALMQGKIRISGDINLPMGLLGALTSP